MTTFFAPTVDWAYLAPLVVVLGAGVVGVLVEAFVPASARRATQLALALVALVAAIVLVGTLWTDVTDQGYVDVLGGALRLTVTTLGIQAVVLVLALVAVLVVADRSADGLDAFAPTAAAVPGSPYEELARRKGLVQTEVFPLTMFAVGGMMIFGATIDLLTMFVALEVLSLPLYVLTASARRRRLLSQEAALKYFLLGAFASALFLFGTALLYGATGSVNLEAIAEALAQGGAGGPTAGMTGMVVVAVLLLLAGVLFKVGAVPFHVWTPDVYQGAPTPVTGFMAACTKAAAFGALVQVALYVGTGLQAGAPDTFRALEVALCVVAVASMVVGTVVALPQTDIKRVLGYSAIAHTGFVLVAVLGLLGRPTPEAGVDALGAVVFYVLAYGLATIGAFAVVTLVRESDGARDGVVLGEATQIRQWSGLGRRSPWLAGLFALFLLSMAGIPLTAGFIAKFGAFRAGVDGGFAWLAVVGVLASAVAVFFYVRIVVIMFFADAPADDDAAPRPDGDALVPDVPVRAVRPRAPVLVALVLCALGVIGLGVFPAPVLNLLG
ncbi:NADH dehydrogenase subunit N [Sediminihabitans luteus]|uniref:NADH-quinone oxidoreductase subunit N n=1 Tax=Sediminihabitans luteus TaxID=1138585 RepID=A0A2M9CZP7_9CELL|nr:NADH-quinone oxidoreductase subunit NuoN [Sediminihabitans luteus]PJJ77323.1 NADH dehydrogenase subunit N [Sediminihabitans luteus]GII98774.1 NADH-quinone oxidoreductase subunit N [Sediminihabitans luteus]